MKHVTLRKGLLSLLLIGGVLCSILWPVASPAPTATTENNSDLLNSGWLQEWDHAYGTDLVDGIGPATERYEPVAFTPFQTFSAPEPMPDLRGRTAMRQLLTRRLAMRGFSEEINQLFYDTFDAIYQNYASWLPLYREMPEVDTYVYDHLIAPIAQLRTAVFYDEDGAEGKALSEAGEPSGWTTWDGDGYPELYVILPRRETRDELAQRHAIEVFYHELTHCHDTNFFENYEYYSQFSTDLAEFVYSLTEGSTTFHQKFTYPYRVDFGAAWSVESQEQHRVISYRKDGGTGYMLNLNDYEKLFYFAGYRQMELLTTGQQPFDSVAQAIEALCGEDATRQLLEVMVPRIVLYDRDGGYALPKTYTLSIEIEQAFFRCIQERLTRVDTWDGLMLEARLWDRYKECNLPYVEDTSTDMWRLMDYDPAVTYHARNYENNGVDYDDYVGEYDPTYTHNPYGEDENWKVNYDIYHHLLSTLLTDDLFGTSRVDQAFDQVLHRLLA